MTVGVGGRWVRCECSCPYRSCLRRPPALIEPVFAAWRARRTGPGTAARVHDLREIVNAILYVDRTGIPWEYPPHDSPPYKTVYDYCAEREADGTTQQVHDLLRDKARRPHGRSTQPTAAVIDAQSVRTSANVAETGQGIDAGETVRRPTYQPSARTAARASTSTSGSSGAGSRPDAASGRCPGRSAGLPAGLADVVRTSSLQEALHESRPRPRSVPVRRGRAPADRCPPLGCVSPPRPRPLRPGRWWPGPAPCGRRPTCSGRCR
ncbi:transposase [Streptomyces sp. WG7]|uniref:transposase n=1 Tax=Streptomyces sp. WG7 TaxID=3417650 RepID=UPI003CE6C6DF